MPLYRSQFFPQSPQRLLDGVMGCILWVERLIYIMSLSSKDCIFTHKNPFENVIWKMAAIRSRPQCAKKRICASSGSCFTNMTHNCSVHYGRLCCHAAITVFAYCFATHDLEKYPPNTLIDVLTNRLIFWIHVLSGKQFLYYNQNFIKIKLCNFTRE